MPTRFALALLLLFLLGCTSESSESANSEIDVVKDANAMWEREIEKLPPGTTIDGTDTLESKRIINNTGTIYEKSGGAELVKSDLYEEKCNRYMLTYQLKEPVTNTATLKVVTRYLGHTWHLKNIQSKQSGCRFKPMTSLFLYDNEEKEFYGDWLAMIAFNPEHPNGEVSLSWRLK